MAYDENHRGAHNYHDAIVSYKFANAAKKRRDEWFASDDRADEIEKYVCGRSGFLGDMCEAIDKYGAPTPAQRAAIIKCIDADKARQAKWDAEMAKSQHVGTVGQRQEFTATVVFKAAYETIYGYAFVVGMKADDNFIVSKGTSKLACAQKGDTVQFMAMVKEHGERDGQKQTVVTRPTKIKINGGAR
jgi:hypothetical protein